MTVRAHPAISAFAAKIVEWLQICHWLKVQSRRLKNYIFAKKCILISFCIAYIIPSHFIIALYFTLWMLDFSIPSRC